MIFHRLLVFLMTSMRRSRTASINLILITLGISILGNSLTFWYFDGAAATDGSGPSFGDALWYSVISITTIGYGDMSSTSLGARIGTVIFIVFTGLVSFSMLIGLLADWALEFSMKGQRGMAKIEDLNHIVIINMPSEDRLRQIIRELKGDHQHGKSPMVLVSDRVKELPVSGRKLSFVHGSPLDIDTLKRANVDDAALILVLPISYSDPNSDAVAAATVSLLQQQAPGKRIVAECLDEGRRNLFGKIPPNVSVVCGLQVVGNLLIQELADPGVSQTMEMVTSNLKGSTLYSTTVDSSCSKNYVELAKALLDDDANLLSVIRNDQTHTAFTGLSAEVGDKLIYAGTKRFDWPTLVHLSET